MFTSNGVSDHSPDSLRLHHHSRIVSEQALRRLTADQKVRLSDEFASMRAYSYIPLIVTLLLVFGLRSQQLDCPALHLASH